MSLVHLAINPANKGGPCEGKSVRLINSETVRSLYPESMHGVMLLGKPLSRDRYEVLCEDGQIRVVDLQDIEAAEL